MDFIVKYSWGQPKMLNKRQLETHLQTLHTHSINTGTKPEILKWPDICIHNPDKADLFCNIQYLSYKRKYDIKQHHFNVVSGKDVVASFHIDEQE